MNRSFEKSQTPAVNEKNTSSGGYFPERIC